jgi:hypothetical protein
MPEFTDELTAKLIEELRPPGDCDARVQIIRLFKNDERDNFVNFRVWVSSARPAAGFSAVGKDVQSFVYETVWDTEELFLIESIIGTTKLFRHKVNLSQGHRRIPLEEVMDFPDSGHFVSIESGEIVISHKSFTGCFQSARILNGIPVIPDKRMLLWYLLGRVPGDELRMLANIYERNKYCV